MMDEEEIIQDEGRPFEELLEQARKVGENEQHYWDSVDILRKRGDYETLNAVLKLRCGDKFERSFAATVLAKFGEPHVFSTKVVNRLLEMLEVEKDDDVLASLASALGHREPEPRVVEALRVLSLHPAWKVRWPVTLALADYQTPEAIELLIRLSADADAVIRDWATFGLNNRDDLDTPAVRAAFMARLEDEDAHTRAEALYGLAELHDSRVVSAVLRELNGENGQHNIFDVIESSPDYRLLPALREMAASPESPENDPDIQAAIAACEAHEKQQSHET